MEYTTIPSIKGQITIPPAIRKKYHISKNTPVVVEDKGNGNINLKIMQMVDHDAITFYEDEKITGLRFKNGFDPQKLIDAIDEMYGQD